MAVDFDMFSDLLDPLCEERHLYLGGACVPFVVAVSRREAILQFLGQHIVGNEDPPLTFDRQHSIGDSETAIRFILFGE